MSKRRDGHEGWTRQYEAAYERIFGTVCRCSGDCGSFSGPGEPAHMTAIRGLRKPITVISDEALAQLYAEGERQPKKP